MSATACPLCGGGKVAVFLKKRRGQSEVSALGSSRKTISPGELLRCRDCSFGFRQTRFNQQELADLYRKMDTKLYEAEIRGRKRTAERHLGIFHANERCGRLLDVGCASGLFLFAAAERGWQVTGLEPAEVLYREAQERLAGRGTVLPLTLEESDLPEHQFDVVTLWDVLEHVADPLNMMGRCQALLKPGGSLFLNVPDLDSVEARILGRQWPLLLPEHLNYFNRPSLKLCAQKCGLQLRRFGRRRAFFSVQYVCYRLSRHRIRGAALLGKAAQMRMGRFLIPVSLGETYAVLTNTSRTA